MKFIVWVIQGIALAILEIVGAALSFIFSWKFLLGAMAVFMILVEAAVFLILPPKRR